MSESQKKAVGCVGALSSRQVLHVAGQRAAVAAPSLHAHSHGLFLEVELDRSGEVAFKEVTLKEGAHLCVISYKRNVEKLLILILVIVKYY